tara:strand:+ start:258 stop:479 length:222 start_codon:yes stop_codon:yes gene_type:complete
MGKLIEELAHLPIEGQEFILSGLASDYIPIQIDDIVYVIPKEVNQLIKGLAEVLDKESEMKGDLLSNLEKLKK